MIPSSANLPDGVKWTDFDNDYTAEERGELIEAKRRWEDGQLSDQELVSQFFDKSHPEYAWSDRANKTQYGIRIGDRFTGRMLVRCEHETIPDAWHEAAKEILRGVL
jgi:hypothetical protein